MKSATHLLVAKAYPFYSDILSLQLDLFFPRRKKGMTLFDEGLSLCFTKVIALALESGMAARQ